MIFEEKLLSNYDYFIIDLDNTLFLEIDYLFQGYLEISKKVSELSNLNQKDKMHQYLKEHFLNIGRKNLFDNFLQEFNIQNFKIIDCLKILRNFNPVKNIYLFKEMYFFLLFLVDNKKKIIVVTNGNVNQQKNKIRSIKWFGLNNSIEFVYANNYKPKPSIASFEYIYYKYKNQIDRTLMIGDMLSDEEYARNAKIDYLDIKELKKNMKNK